MGVTTRRIQKSEVRMQKALLVIIIILTGVAAAGCKKKEIEAASVAEAPAVPVKAVQVKAEPFSLTVAVTGTLVSNARVDVKAEIVGHLVKFPKQEGDTVTAGEALAWVDPENYELAARQAETAVQVAEATLARTRVLAAHNRTELERAQNLIKSGGITDKELSAAQVTERDGQAQIALAEAQLAQARAALEVARKKLRDTVIHAPVDGAIERKFVNPGAYVEGPTQLLTIVDNRRLELESPVPSAQLGQIRAGQTVTFRVNSYPGDVFAGKVIEISPTVDAQARSAKVRIHVDNRSGKLRTGMFVEGSILTGVEQQAIVIPTAAVYRSDSAATVSSVFVVENNKAVRRAVRLGRETDSRIEVTEGLKPGDLLIAEQRIELAEGVRVAPEK